MDQSTRGKTESTNHGDRRPVSQRPSGSPQPARPPKLLDQLRQALRSGHYSRKTEQSYCHWVKRFVRFHNLRHPSKLGEPEINAFLSHLALKRKVSASTQTQALSAILFLYQRVLKRELGHIGDAIRARRPKRLPVVMTRDEARIVLDHLEGQVWLMASLMYGAGLRLMECLRLRVQDVDFAANQIAVRSGKGFKDRVTMLPQAAKQPLMDHLVLVKRIHERDLAEGYGRVTLPHALARKYPNAASE
jgi:integron integrase